MSEAQEQEIERSIAMTLASIGNTAPPEGMERRLKLALQHHAVHGSHRSIFRDWRWIVPATGLAIVAITAVTIRKAQNTSVSSVADLQASRPVTPVHLPGLQVTASSPAQQPRQLHTYVRPMPIALERRSAFALSAAAEHDQPPPPMPLTAEEKLLVQVVHRGEPLQMASLDDAHSRGIDFAAQKQQFDDFFYLNAQESSNDAN